MKRTLLFFILFLFLSSVVALPVFALGPGLSFGGKVTSVPLPCVNIPGAFQFIILDHIALIPIPVSFIWAQPPLTATCFSNGKCINTPLGTVGVGAAIPPHVGQTMLGTALLTPTVCVVAGFPIPGFLMQVVGTSLI